MENEFKHLDPDSGNVPWSPFAQILDIAQRAALLLEDRSSEEIIAAITTTDRIIDQSIEDYNHQHPQDTPEDGLVERVDISDTQHMKMCCEQVMSSDTGFKDGKHFEYFSAIALWKTEEGLNALKKVSWKKSTMRDMYEVNMFPLEGSTQLIVGFSLLLEAADALAYAEQRRNAKRYQSEISSKGGSNRSMKYRDIENHAIDLYIRKHFKDPHKAGYILFPEVKRYAFDKHDIPLKRQRTIVEWLEKYIQNKKISPN